LRRINSPPTNTMDEVQNVLALSINNIPSS
jgi:hypothetical protein